MGLTTAMYSGLSGLNAHQARIDTIGNNVANVNTNAFKSSRTLFQTQFYETLTTGTPPSDTSGGVNPLQYGKGVVVGTTQRDDSFGSIETTGLNTDLAIEGSGYFVLRTSGGRQVFTRDGAFTLNSRNELVTQDGHYLQGFGVDENFSITPTILNSLTVPLGTQTIARATTRVAIDGDLSSAGSVATRGSINRSQALVAGGGAPAAAGTALTDLRSATAPGVALFASGDSITISGVSKGERELPAATFTVGTDGSTLGDFAAWLQNKLGLQTATDTPGAAGVTIDAGRIVITGNYGEVNDIEITSNDILSSSSAIPRPLSFTQDQTATGSGVFTSFTVYDSLGSPVVLQATFTLEATPSAGPVWRYYLESPDTTSPSRAIGSGTITFDTQGNFVSATGNQVTLERAGEGATTPVTVTIDFSSLAGLSTQSSSAILSDQDGFPPGVLNGFSVGQDGLLIGSFSNGLTRTLGQVALATFANDNGLVAESENLYALGPNAGAAAIKAPGQLGAGTIRGGALELSNVDLAREFIGLVTSSNGFQANSRVISVTNDLLSQLLLILR